MLKIIAKKLKVPVLVLSQLNRDIATLIVAKHRSGPVGEVNMRFRNDITRFEEIGEG